MTKGLSHKHTSDGCNMDLSLPFRVTNKNEYGCEYRYRLDRSRTKMNAWRLVLPLYLDARALSSTAS
jgi:hypothetical protein